MFGVALNFSPGNAKRAACPHSHLIKEELKQKLLEKREKIRGFWGEAAEGMTNGQGWGFAPGPGRRRGGFCMPIAEVILGFVIPFAHSFDFALLLELGHVSLSGS
jgi:hypothetical protein